MDRYPIVMVRWVDAVSPSGWRSIRAMQKREPEQVITIGFLIQQTRNKLVLAGSLSGSECGELIVIPRSWVTQMQKLSKGHKSRA